MLTIPHDDDLKPGTWKGGWMQGHKPNALVCCPNGHIASLTDHEIKADGTVWPSLVCPYDGCGFHEFVRLEGWHAPAN